MSPLNCHPTICNYVCQGQWLSYHCPRCEVNITLVYNQNSVIAGLFLLLCVRPLPFFFAALFRGTVSLSSPCILVLIFDLARPDSQIRCTRVYFFFLMITHRSTVLSIFGASLSEPHIVEFAVNFLYIYICHTLCLSHFLLLFCVCQLFVDV